MAKTYNQGLLGEKTERQVRHPGFPPKKSRVHRSLHKGIRELRRVLTRYHYVDVGADLVFKIPNLPAQRGL